MRSLIKNKYFVLFSATVVLCVAVFVAKSHVKFDFDKDDKDDDAKVSTVGKGIVKTDDKEGFILSAQAKKNFSYTTMKLQGSGPWSIPSTALLFSEDEVYVYRIRKDFIKRIKFEESKKSSDNLSINSKELASGDEIITSEVGTVRVAELAAFGEIEEEH